MMTTELKKLSVLEWARERHQNTIRIAAMKTGADREGWLEDQTYWREIVAKLEQVGLAEAPRHSGAEWQPIETAPKDGTRVLAYRDSGVGMMRWRERENDTGGFWDEWHVKRPAVPTHWMPLPAPPHTDPPVGQE